MKRRGFTLVEVLIALTIISITFVGVSGLISSNLRNNQLNQSMITANYLNMEQLEVIRHMRDTSWLNNFAFSANTSEIWQESLYPETGVSYFKIEENQNQNSGQKYFLIKTDNTFASNRLFRLERDGVSYFSHDNSGRKTNFARFVAVEKYENDQLQNYEGLSPLKITAKTLIDLNGNVRELSYNLILSDWKQGPL